jgi:hypothetical protein
MSSKETCDNPGLHPTEGQKSSLGAQTGTPHQMQISLSSAQWQLIFYFLKCHSWHFSADVLETVTILT